MPANILMICKECGSEFYVWPYIIRKGFGHFCSEKCRIIRAGDKLKNIRKRNNNIIELDTHCEMTITNKRGVFVVIFDKDDLELINKHTWSIGNNGYANTNTRHGIRTTLHRFIMNTPSNMDTDHINHNQLDNRRINLRICSTSQNLMNTTIRGGRKYKGISNQF